MMLSKITQSKDNGLYSTMIQWEIIFDIQVSAYKCQSYLLAYKQKNDRKTVLKLGHLFPVRVVEEIGLSQECI